jgi:hypothetical protein
MQFSTRLKLHQRKSNKPKAWLQNQRKREKRLIIFSIILKLQILNLSGVVSSYLHWSTKAKMEKKMSISRKLLNLLDRTGSY